MRQFVDGKGRRWDVSITVASVKRVRAVLGVDLAQVMADGARPLAQILGDPCRLVDVLYVLCQPQATAAGVSDEEFGSSLGGDSLSDAADAFVEELVDFMPDARARSQLRALLAHGRAAMTRLLAESEQMVLALDPADLAAKMMFPTSAKPAEPTPASRGTFNAGRAFEQLGNGG